MSKATVTIRHVAERAKVSTATVSRVLNNNPCVRQRTRQTVLEAIDSLGYKLNVVARSLKTSRTHTIGVLAPDLSGDFFMFIAESMNRELARRGYSLVVGTSQSSEEEEAKQVRHLAERLVDGIVLIPVGGSNAYLPQISDFNIPIVFVDRILKGYRADKVLVDNEEGACKAVSALIGEGHHRIGYLGGNPEVTTAEERYKGYCRAMKEAGLEIEQKYVRFGNPTLPFGYRAMEDIIKDPYSPNTWFIVNIFTHLGATNYLISEGEERTRQITFASFDEMPYSPLLRYCRYAVQQPIAEMGKAAANLIIDRIEGIGPPEPQTLRFKTRLIQHKLVR
ncbi:MAG TPA: LacI family DNA-binding transcriptional regulator [Rectinema sp.]|nr:LacI family DNA-binding transcriptional regulator [Spirochaetota bacterium]HOE98998.1 LacI family DNA-binding transcriptional regulator [Rectinema sp.]HOI98074.1 LacI family DNA-binding transcriptional regulator [Rectinema sp.]HOO02192.1 LacI family DNA-binding transcriptional regulator [Rectinema sp.]HOR91851.1 LacI family DNA-binding transcriptional regulator [Rectinema sp.]